MIPKRYFNGDEEGNSSNNRRLNIFVKRNEYARFLSLLSRRVLTPTVGKSYDESHSIDKFNSSSSRDKRYQNEISRNHIEFSTKFVSKNTAVLRSISKNPYLLGVESFSPDKAAITETSAIIDNSADVITQHNETNILGRSLAEKENIRSEQNCTIFQDELLVLQRRVLISGMRQLLRRKKRS